MKYASVIFFVIPIFCFWWARRRFFRRDDSTSKLRGGLAPAGGVFAFLDLVLLAISDGLSEWPFYVGTFLMVASFLVFWFAVFSFRGRAPRIAHTPGDLLEINREGPYRYVRHPFYLSYILCWVGAAVYVIESWRAFPALLMAVVMIALYARAARGEESDLLRSSIGAEYRAYRGSAGMFLPKIRRILGER